LKIEIITIGDEILSGDIIDTNKSWLSEQCWKLGFSVSYHTGIRDDEGDIQLALTQAATRSDIILCTGGLGPTADDFTIEIAAKTFGQPRILDESTIQYLEKWYAKRGRVMSENNRKQALVPQGCRVLTNRWGTAPGCQVEFRGKTFFFMPGVPGEMKGIFGESILPFLRTRCEGGLNFASVTLKTFGCPESDLDRKLSDLYEDRLNIQGVRVGFRARMPEVYIKLSAWAETADVAKANVACVRALVESRVGEFVYTDDDRSLAQVLVEAAIQKNKTFAIAESCTGGLIASRITDVPGASQVFLGGVTSYADAVKISILGVDTQTLQQHGAVSEACALEMVRGIYKLTGADFCASITGIAGPSGGSDDKPVGTVFLAYLMNGAESVEKHFFPFRREMFKNIVSSLVLRKFWQACR